MNNLGVKARETMDVEVKPLPYAAEIIEDESFEMANLNPPTTGLRQRIWVSSNLQVSHNRPRLRIKASDAALYPVSVDEPIEFLAGWAPGLSAADFKTLQQFILLNRAILLRYWNDEIGTEDMIRHIQPV